MTKHQSNLRKNMPKPSEVRAFWAVKLLALGKVIDTEQVLDAVGEPNSSCYNYQCFCCGVAGPLDRAHTHPLWAGGSNDVSNIHMLCRTCHHTSEGFSEDAYWRWFLSVQWRCCMDPHHYTHLFIAAGYSGWPDMEKRLRYLYAKDKNMYEEETQRVLSFVQKGS